MKKTEFILAVFASIAVVVGAGATCFFVTQRNAEMTKTTPVVESPSSQNTNKLSNSKKIEPPTELSILNAVNIERAKVGVAPLKLHPNLSKTAQMKADDMIARNYRGHYMPDTNQPLTEEMKSLQVAACINSSENLAWNDRGTDTKQSIDWWLSSPPHKAAMLDPKYTYTGIGVGDGRVVVQHFCVAR